MGVHMARQAGPFQRTVLVLLTLGALVGGAAFIGILAGAVYLSVSAGNPAILIFVSMSGLPLFSGVSAVLLGFAARSHIENGGSRGTLLMAVYALAFMCVVALFTVYARYAPDS